MKSSLIAVISILVMMACKESTPRYASSSPEIDSLKALVNDYENGNWEAWMSHYADTAKLYHNSIEASTPQEIRNNLAALLADVSSYEFDKDDIFYEMVLDDDGETWVNFWGDWKGTLAANDETLNIPVHITAQFVDGKIVREHAYYDLSKYMAAMQAIKEAEMNEEEPME